MTVTCVLGPVSITRQTPPAAAAQPDVASAALSAGPGGFVLVDGQPTAVGTVWRDLLAPLLRGSDEAVLIHPGWWTAPQLELVRSVAAEFVCEVELVPRAAILGDSDTVIEIAPHAVLVVGPNGPLGLVHRTGESVVSRVAALIRAGPVVIDGPADVPGAAVLAGALTAALTRRGMRVHADRCIVAAEPVESTGSAKVIPTRWVAAAAVMAALVAAGALIARPHGQPRTPPRALVEGRVTMQIPAGWTVDRVTDGPGSARAQVVSPEDPDAVVHLTQSRIAQPDLASTATALRVAIDAEPPGTFVDFDPAGHRAGRPAVTYREIRPGRDIVWTVLVDGDLRISIGCQNGIGRAEAITSACDDAIRTAQRLE